MLLTTTIGAYPKPPDVPVRDWFQRDGTDSAEPTAGYAETVRAAAHLVQLNPDYSAESFPSDTGQLGRWPAPSPVPSSIPMRSWASLSPI